MFEDALLENIDNVRGNIPQGMLAELIDSMPHRVKAVLDTAGDHT